MLANLVVPFCNTFWICIRKWYRMYLVNVFKTSPLPKHIAIILDGNRRYARKRNWDVKEGHRYVYRKTVQFFQQDLNKFPSIQTTEITGYLFSTSNYRRSPTEVEALMELFNEAALKGLQSLPMMKNSPTKLCILGDISPFPTVVRSNIAKLALMSQNQNVHSTTVNAALGYSSTNELTTVIQQILQCIQSKDLMVNDIDEDLIEKCLYTNLGTAPEVLVRPSGVHRFSDFLTWQTGGSLLLFFEHCLPELNTWDLMVGILRYQSQMKNLKRIQSQFKVNSDFTHNLDPMRMKRVDTFVEKLNEQRNGFLKSFVLEEKRTNTILLL